MAKALTTFKQLVTVTTRLFSYCLLFYGLFSLFRFLFSLSGTWTTNYNKSTVLPKMRLQPSEEEIEQNAHLLFQHIENQLTLCDIKAYLTILTNTIFIILLLIDETQSLQHGLQLSIPPLHRLAAFCLLLVLFTLLCSSFYALRTILPALQDRNRISLLYFGHIAELHHDKFVSNFQSQPLRELKESLLSEVHTKARIARRKLSLASWSIGFFFAALLFWVLAQLILMLQV